MRSTGKDTARRPGTLRAALAHRTYRQVLAAYGIGVAAVGASGVVVAISLYERTGSPAWAGVSAVARMLPFLLFSPFAGVVVDRTDPRRMLCVAVAGQIAVGIVLAATVEHAPLAVVAGLGFVASLFWTLAYPSTTALVPRTVGTEDLAPANALLTTADTIAWAMGPAVAGLLLGAQGYIVAALTATAVGVVATAFGLAAQRRPLAELAIQRGPPEPFLQAFRTGVRAIRGTSEIVVPLALVLVAYFVFGAFEVLVLVAATDLLDMGRGGYGALNAAYGVGCFAALVIVNRLARTRRTTVWLGAGVLAAGLPLAFLAAVETPAIGLALVTVCGLGSVISDVLILAAMQRNVAADRLARVFGILESLLLAAVLAGSAISAWLVALVGIRGALVITGAAIPVAAVAALPRLLRRPAEPAIDVVGLRPEIELLAALPVLRAASRTSVETLAAAATRESLGPGRAVVTQGEHPDDFFAIVSGEFDVVIADHEGTATRAAALGPGDGFGEIGLLQGIPRTATVVATTSGEVLRVPGVVFLRAVGPGSVNGGVGPATGAIDYFTAG